MYTAIAASVKVPACVSNDNTPDAGTIAENQTSPPEYILQVGVAAMDIIVPVEFMFVEVV